jgi:hypothetical protein
LRLSCDRSGNRDECSTPGFPISLECQSSRYLELLLHSYIFAYLLQFLLTFSSIITIRANPEASTQTTGVQQLASLALGPEMRCDFLNVRKVEKVPHGKFRSAGWRESGYALV